MQQMQPEKKIKKPEHRGGIEAAQKAIGAVAGGGVLGGGFGYGLERAFSAYFVPTLGRNLALTGGRALIAGSQVFKIGAGGLGIVLSPAVAVGFGVGALGVGTYQAYNWWHHRNYAESVLGLNDERVREIHEMISDNKENGITLTLDNFSDEFAESLYTLFDSEKSNVKSLDSNENFIQTLEIDGATLTDNQWGKLLDSNMGRFNTKHLVINNIVSIRSFEYKLAHYFNQGSFSKLISLDLSRNQISASNLKHISAIGGTVSITELNLSHNQLTPITDPTNSNHFKRFLSNLYRDFPNLEKLNLQHCHLGDKDIDALTEMLKSMTMLKEIDVSYNNFSLTGLRRLTKSDAFQNNISINTFHMGRESDPIIKKMIEERSEKLKALKKDVGAQDDDILPLVIMNNIKQDNDKVEPFFKFIRNSYSSKAEVMRCKQQWKDIVKDLPKDFSGQKAKWVEYILEKGKIVPLSLEQAELKANEKKVKALLKSLTRNDGKDKAIKINGKQGTGQEAIAQLEEALMKIEENGMTPMIRDVRLTHLNLKLEVFDNLLTGGLGAFGAEALDLSHNQLDDSFMKYLGNIPDECFPDLKVINLSHNQITANGLIDLLKFVKNRPIEKIILRENPLQPSSAEQGFLFQSFCFKLSHLVPCLKSLDLKNVGLDHETMPLVTNLLHRHSLLSSLNIEQATVRTYRTYEQLLKTPQFKANLNLMDVKTGKNRLRSISKHLKEKQQVRKKIAAQIRVDENASDFLLSLLTYRLQHPDFSGPQKYNEWLNAINLNEKIALFDKGEYELDMMCRIIKFHQIKSRAMYPDRLAKEEVSLDGYLHLRNNELEKQWPQRSDDLGALSDSLDRHKVEVNALVHEEMDLKLAIIHRFEQGGNEMVIALGEDDLIRIINKTTDSYFVVNRYLHAMELFGDRVFELEINRNLSLQILANGSYGFQLNNELLFGQHGLQYIRGASCQLSVVHANLADFAKVDELSELFRAALEPEHERRQPVGFLPQYQASRQSQDPILAQTVDPHSRPKV